MKTTLLTLVLLFVSFFGFSQHVYQFNGALTGSGPTLTEVFDATCAPAGVAGSYSTEYIHIGGGSNSYYQKPVFLFNENAGLSYNNSAGLGITGTYTINILFRKSDYLLGNFSFQKVIDFSNGTNDDGLYSNYNGGTPQLDNVYGVTPHQMGVAANLVNDFYYLVTLVRGAGTATNVDFYLNGTFITNYDDAGGIYASNGTDPIVFFRDDISAPATFHCESGPGAVRYISLSNTTSTAGQVSTFFSSLVNVVLPVNLTAFNAQKNGNSGLLQWQTATEVNAAYYNVERSYDGINFTTISKVNAKGQASNTYTFNDASGLSSTNTYYRLKIVDNNGNFKYSSVVRLANGQGIKVSVFPNPASEVVTVSGLKANDNIKLLSIDGKLLLQQNASGAQSMIVNIAKYKPGTYILQVKNDAEVSQQKIVKY
jgi:hypothetical protein